MHQQPTASDKDHRLYHLVSVNHLKDRRTRLTSIPLPIPTPAP